MSFIKKVIRKFFPNFFPTMHIVLGFVYDIKKFSKHSSVFNPSNSKYKLDALLRRQYHGIEKGLSFPNPRLGFGIDLLDATINNLLIYYKKYGSDEIVFLICDVLKQYKIFNIELKNEIQYKEIFKKIDDTILKITQRKNYIKSNTGYELISKNEIFSVVENFDFKSFIESRHSVRDFSNLDITKDLIETAINLALKTPSQCNRQPWKVYVYKGDDKDRILKFQNGNQGFGHLINTALLITATTSSFSQYERHSAWVDGGLFSMSLIYAFHSLKIGVCPLNLGLSYFDEKKLRDGTKIKEDEEPIMMLGIGHLKDEFKVCVSKRKNNKDIVKYE